MKQLIEDFFPNRELTSQLSVWLPDGYIINPESFATFQKQP